ncbi:unnamed protein product [Vitrella brassicaformis CCMP3155]|uniref:Bromo domain-containing protein n=2 Tax=Vitrella brassicaformis TaxID=1169539 RepID=A0A0G4H3Q8_VITBC|nr:unnamed protein product [Vitrella brassicaformis CCMP3155]|eukprot:CEM38364.1 unnamed protein product [Vitrella brassicaformis CCMP3155]
MGSEVDFRSLEVTKVCARELGKLLTGLRGEHWQLFQERVSDEVPGYYDMIKRPMWLKEINNKINRSDYRTFQDVKEDFDLMFSNCRQFNTNEASKYIIDWCAKAEQEFNNRFHTLAAKYKAGFKAQLKEANERRNLDGSRAAPKRAATSTSSLGRSKARSNGQQPNGTAPDDHPMEEEESDEDDNRPLKRLTRTERDKERSPPSKHRQQNGHASSAARRAQSAAENGAMRPDVSMRLAAAAKAAAAAELSDASPAAGGAGASSRANNNRGKGKGGAGKGGKGGRSPPRRAATTREREMDASPSVAASEGQLPAWRPPPSPLTHARRLHRAKDKLSIPVEYFDLESRGKVALDAEFDSIWSQPYSWWIVEGQVEPLLEEWRRKCLHILKDLWFCGNSHLFHYPVQLVNGLDYNEYSKVVPPHQQADFRTIRQRLCGYEEDFLSGSRLRALPDPYQVPGDFKSDVDKVFINCMKFNKSSKGFPGVIPGVKEVQTRWDKAWRAQGKKIQADFTRYIDELKKKRAEPPQPSPAAPAAAAAAAAPSPSAPADTPLSEMDAQYGQTDRALLELTGRQPAAAQARPKALQRKRKRPSKDPEPPAAAAASASVDAKKQRVDGAGDRVEGEGIQAPTNPPSLPLVESGLVDEKVAPAAAAGAGGAPLLNGHAAADGGPVDVAKLFGEDEASPSPKQEPQTQAAAAAAAMMDVDQLPPAAAAAAPIPPAPAPSASPSPSPPAAAAAANGSLPPPTHDPSGVFRVPSLPEKPRKGVIVAKKKKRDGKKDKGGAAAAAAATGAPAVRAVGGVRVLRVRASGADAMAAAPPQPQQRQSKRRLAESRYSYAEYGPTTHKLENKLDFEKLRREREAREAAAAQAAAEAADAAEAEEEEPFGDEYDDGLGVGVGPMLPEDDDLQLPPAMLDLGAEEGEGMMRDEGGEGVGREEVMDGSLPAERPRIAFAVKKADKAQPATLPPRPSFFDPPSPSDTPSAPAAAAAAAASASSALPPDSSLLPIISTDELRRQHEELDLMSKAVMEEGFHHFAAREAWSRQLQEARELCPSDGDGDGDKDGDGEQEMDVDVDQGEGRMGEGRMVDRTGLARYLRTDEDVEYLRELVREEEMRQQALEQRRMSVGDSDDGWSSDGDDSSSSPSPLDQEEPFEELDEAAEFSDDDDSSDEHDESMPDSLEEEEGDEEGPSHPPRPSSSASGSSSRHVTADEDMPMDDYDEDEDEGYEADDHHMLWGEPEDDSYHPHPHAKRGWDREREGEGVNEQEEEDDALDDSWIDGALKLPYRETDRLPRMLRDFRAHRKVAMAERKKREKEEAEKRKVREAEKAAKRAQERAERRRKESAAAAAAAAAAAEEDPAALNTFTPSGSGPGSAAGAGGDGDGGGMDRKQSIQSIESV